MKDLLGIIIGIVIGAPAGYALAYVMGLAFLEYVKFVVYITG